MMKKTGLLLLAAIILLLPFASPKRPVNAEGAEQGVELNILMYHHISASPSKLNKYTILPSDFEDDIVQLKKRGYTFILMQDLIDYTENKKDLPPKPVLLTFDDGYLSFYRYAYPILQRHEAKAVFSVIGIHAEKYTAAPDPNVNYAHATWPQLTEMNDSPYVEVQNHTYDMHRAKPRRGASKKAGETVAAYRATLADDIGKLQNALQSRCGFMPTTFTYPFGYVSDESCQVIRNMGFKASLTCWEGVNLIGRNPECLFLLRRYNRPAKINFAQLMSRIEKVHA